MIYYNYRKGEQKKFNSGQSRGKVEVMKKTIYIYDNDRQTTGVYASDKFARSHQGGDWEEVTIEIPDDMKPYQTETGETMVKCGDYFYSLDERIRIDKNDRIYIKSMEPGTRARYLKIVSRNGRKSRAFTI